MDKEIVKIQKEEAKLHAEIKAQAAAKNKSAVENLTRSVVRSRTAVKRLETTKANLHAVTLQLQTSIATMSTASSLKVSADVLARMNKICDVDGVSETMKAMQKEMARCGEAEGAMEKALADPEEELETSEQMAMIWDEMALDVSGFMDVGVAAPPVAAPEVAAPAAKQKAAPVAMEAGPAPPPKPKVEPAPKIAPAPKAEPPPAAAAPSTEQPPAEAAELPPAEPIDPILAARAESLQPPSAPPAGYAPAEAPTAPPAPSFTPVGATAPPPGAADGDDDLMARLEALRK